jgi:DNA-binding transcriptional LysR family regulator
MDLKQLECFIAVAEERHFTRAAQRLNIVQSGLSQTIKALEDELGGPLFSRSTRHVDLTPAGKVLLKEATRVLNAAREARLAVTEVHGLARGQLRIGSIQSLAPFVDLPASLSLFREKFPGIDVQLLLDGAAPLLDEVAEGRLDIAFTQPGEIPTALTTRMLACEDVVLVCAQNHKLSFEKPPLLAALAEYTFVDLKADWGMRRLIDRSFALASVARKTAFEVNDISMLLDLVGRGLGVALLPESIAQARSNENNAMPIKIIELADREPPCWELVVGFKGFEGKPSDRVAQNLLELLVSMDGKAIQYSEVDV